MAQVGTGYKWGGINFTSGVGLPSLKKQSRRRNADPGMVTEASLDAPGAQNLLPLLWEPLKKQ